LWLSVGYLMADEIIDRPWAVQFERGKQARPSKGKMGRARACVDFSFFFAYSALSFLLPVSSKTLAEGIFGL
jgi:hypothetical protein